MNIDINIKKKRLSKIILIPIIIFVFALGSFLFLSYSNKEDNIDKIIKFNITNYKKQYTQIDAY